MPGFDRTGPLGLGPRTGWGLGPCGGGRAWGRGGRGRWFGRFFGGFRNRFGGGGRGWGSGFGGGSSGGGGFSE